MTAPSDAESRVLAALMTQAGLPRKQAVRPETLAKATSLPVEEAKDLLAALETRGLVERTPTGSWRATTEGAAQVPRKEPSPRRTREPRPPPLDPAVLLQRIERLEKTLLARLEQLESTLGKTPVAAPERPSPPQLQATVRASVLDLVKERRFGGLVPVPEVRRLVIERSGATPAEVDAALAELDREYALDLKVPNDPALASQGFELPGRGRVYFVVPR